jgi:hypothetical protein
LHVVSLLCPAFRRFSLGSWLRTAACAATLALLVPSSALADSSKITLDTSETLFTILTAINACGYDQELGVSNPLRSQVRADVAKVIASSQEVTSLTSEMCHFYQEHQQQDASRELSQYVSLALYLNGPPDFEPKAKEAEMPPDAVRVLGFVPIVKAFYQKAGLHAIWNRYRPAYDALIERYHEPLTKMMFNTDIYLKLPTAGYLGRQFMVYLEPMGAPGQTNARVYGTDYFVVISPAGASLKIEDIRHTYLHYLLDPMALKRPAAMKRLAPLLDSVRTAPIADSFKNDIALLVTECTIRAIEARNLGSGKAAEARQQKMVDDSMTQGFILTRYFYDALAKFEKDPVGFRDAYSDILGGIDVRAEAKRAANIEFAGNSSPDVLYIPSSSPAQLLVSAENRLSAGDTAGAQKLAQQALDEQREDPGRALFILAQVATMNRDMQGAQVYFQRALGVAKEPMVVAWSHIYLGRISDLKEDRQAAVAHYQAALQAGSALPAAKAAAERGLQQPYEPPVAPQPKQ